MKITLIKFIEHFRPNCSCGTGYSEPDKFHVICDTGFETDVWIDIYCYSNLVHHKFKIPQGIRSGKCCPSSST